MLRPLLATLAAVTLGAGASAVPTQAALPWKACKPAGLQCATLDVPVDRAGVTPGTITLAAKRAPAPSGPSTTAVFALAGGPGQAARPIASSFKKALAPLLRGSDLVVYDQRGTGRSNPLSCAALKARGGSIKRLVSRCATQVGPARAFFTTAQSVEDIEALRIAGGYDSIVLYGVSYGTKVALAYAAAHPTTTQALLLDSVVTPEGPDALRRSTFAAEPRVLGDDLCGSRACAEVTPSITTDVHRLATRLGRRPISGTVVGGSGRRYRATMSAEGLLSVLIAGDLDPTLRAELPGAVKDALSGDAQPILRISARSAGLKNAAHFEAPAADSDALFFTTVCEENTTFPWTRGASQRQRASEAQRAIKAAPAGTFGAFPRSVALGGLPSLCLGWPVASAAPAVPAPLPDVPVLILAGQSDLRTPVEDARAIAARFPRAQLVTVPHSGHSVLGSAPGSCAADAVAAFAAGGTATPCPAIDNPFAPTPRPPSSLTQVPTVRGLSPKIGRTVNAAIATMNDARRQVIGATLGSGKVPKAVGGLRSGSAKVVSLRRLRLRGYEYVPGVRISGSVITRGTSRLTISSATGASGTLTFRGDSVAGVLDGHRISGSRTRTAQTTPDPLPSLDEAVARGRLIAAGA